MAEVHLAQGQLGRLVGVVGQHQHVGTVGGKGQLGQRTGKARTRLDQGEQAARGHVDAGEGAAHVAQGFAGEPVVLVVQHGGVRRQHGSGVAFGLEQPGADVQLVGAHVQDGVVEFARHRQRVPVGACGLDAGFVSRHSSSRGLDGEGGGALDAVDHHAHMGVAQAVGFDGAVQGGQLHTFGALRAVAGGGQFLGALFHGLLEHSGLGDRIDQAPVHGLLAAYAFLAGAENVGQVVAHMALVGHAGQATGARQHAQQRHFGQRHRRRTVIDQHDLVAGQGQFVTAAGAGTVEGRDELQAVVLGRVFDAVAGLVGEFAEVHLPAVAGDAQHENVGARAEHAVAQAGHHHGAHFGVLEADALQRVVQLDVHTQVVAVELEFVARTQAGVFVDVDAQRGDLAVERQVDVLVLGGTGLVIHGQGSAHEGLRKNDSGQ